MQEVSILFVGLLILSMSLFGLPFTGIPAWLGWTVAALWMGAAVWVYAWALTDATAPADGFLLIPFASALAVGFALASPRLIRDAVASEAGYTFIDGTRGFRSFIGFSRRFESKAEYLAIMKACRVEDRATVRRVLKDTRGLSLGAVYDTALFTFLHEYIKGGWPENARQQLSTALDGIADTIRAHGGAKVREYILLGLPLDQDVAMIEAGIPLEYAKALADPPTG